MTGEMSEAEAAVVRERWLAAPTGHPTVLTMTEAEGRLAAALAERQTTPMTYRYGGEHSFFGDLYRARRLGHRDSEQRLHQHMRELEVEMRGRSTQTVPGEFEMRTPVNWTAGTGGNFAPPLWLNQYFATYPRAERVLARLAPNFRLPVGASSVNLPAISTGTSVLDVPLDDASADIAIADTQISSPAVTLSGTQDVPIAMFDQAQAGASLDFVIFKDLRSAYDADLEAQLVAGSGINGQLLGVTNVTGINSITYTDASPTGSEIYPLFGQMMAAIGNNRKIPPTAWLMNTSRAAWLATSENTANSPLLLTNYPSAFPSGAMVFIGVYLDDAIPGTGSTTAQVPVILCIPEDMMVWESDQHADMMLEPLTGTLQVRFQLHGYAAAIVGRQPTGISVLVGSGTVPVSGF